MALRRIDEALADFAKALALKPDYHEAAWNRGLCNLLVGRWREGWPDYERRWQTRPRRRRTGTPAAGRNGPGGRTSAARRCCCIRSRATATPSWRRASCGR